MKLIITSNSAQLRRKYVYGKISCGHEKNYRMTIILGQGMSFSYLYMFGIQ